MRKFTFSESSYAILNFLSITSKNAILKNYGDIAMSPRNGDISVSPGDAKTSVVVGSGRMSKKGKEV